MTFLLSIYWLHTKNIPRVCQLPFRYVIKYENLAKEWPHLLNRWNDPDYSILIEWPLLSFQPFFPVWESAKTRGQRCNCPGRTGDSSKVVLEVEAASRRSTWTSCPPRLWTSSSTSLPQTSPCLATLLKTNFRYNRKIKRLWWGTELSGMNKYKSILTTIESFCQGRWPLLMINWNVESSCQNQQCTQKPSPFYEFIENDQKKRNGNCMMGQNIWERPQRYLPLESRTFPPVMKSPLEKSSLCSFSSRTFISDSSWQVKET